MRPIIAERLWIGNSADLRSTESVLKLGVRAAVDLAAAEPPVQYPRDIIYVRIPLSDGAEDSVALIRMAVSTVAELLRAHIPTLVACSAGMSRSPAIVAAALAIVEDRRPDDVLLQVAASGPHDVAPAFWESVKRAIVSMAGSEIT
jgi:protein-tyrosine phosphatase